MVKSHTELTLSPDGTFTACVYDKYEGRTQQSAKAHLEFGECYPKQKHNDSAFVFFFFINTHLIQNLRGSM